jgi:tetratricopeptide (TPR) repeat protein
MNYSGPSLYAMAKREREQLADYEEAREAFEQMLEQDQSSVALWMENGGVVDHQQTVAAVVKAIADYEEAREAFEQMLEQDQGSVALWMENGGVVDHQQTVAALVKARHIPEVRALLDSWGHEYARFCV